MMMAVALTAVSKFFSSLVPTKLSSPQPPIKVVTSLKLPKTRATEYAPIVTNRATEFDPLVTGHHDITAVVWPSVVNANIFYYYNVQINVGDDDPEEKTLKRFRSAVLRAGIIQECKRRRFFESNREKKKRKAKFAAQRNRKT